MLPDTTERVKVHSPPAINEAIERQIERNIEYYRDKGPEDIERRLDELDREWDMERILEANAAALALFGTLMSFRRRSWSLLPVAVTGFLLQHALQGWCPPVELFRRLKVRTADEIDRERYALMEMLETSGMPTEA